MALLLPRAALRGLVRLRLGRLALRGARARHPDRRDRGRGFRAFMPHAWKFLWAPIVDTTLTRKTWYLHRAGARRARHVRVDGDADHRVLARGADGGGGRFADRADPPLHGLRGHPRASPAARAQVDRGSVAPGRHVPGAGRRRRSRDRARDPTAGRLRRRHHRGDLAARRVPAAHVRRAPRRRGAERGGSYPGPLQGFLWSLVGHDRASWRSCCRCRR